MIKNVFLLLVGASILLAGLAICLISYSYYLKSVAYINNKDKEFANRFVYEHDYQLIQLGEFRRDQFLLDKKTGLTWRPVCDGEFKEGNCTGSMRWQKMDGQDN